jgi:hypothetical protein
MKEEVKEENKQPDKKSINNVYEQFIRNIESVEAFFETFSLKAIEEDKSILESRTAHLENAILKTFGKEGLDNFIKEIEKENEEENIEKEEKQNSIKDIPVEKMEDFLYRITKTPKLQDKNFEILANGAFLILNNHFEYLFADLLTFHFTSNKEVLEEKNISISLNDLKNYSTVEEAYNDILFREVEKILLDLSFDEIKNYFTKLEVSLSENLIGWELINEIRERRHLIVHNNSIVNKKYLSRTDNPFKFEIGNQLDIKTDYLKNAIAEIKLAGIILIMNCWGKWSKENATEAVGELMDLTFELLQTNKNELVLKICEYIDKNIKPRNDDEESYILRAKINNCIALKRLDKKVILNNKLKGIRTGSMSPIFKIAKHLLKNEHKEAVPLIKQSIIVDELKFDNFWEWPLFEDIRMDKKYKELVEKEFETNLP